MIILSFYWSFSILFFFVFSNIINSLHVLYKLWGFIYFMIMRLSSSSFSNKRHISFLRHPQLIFLVFCFFNLFISWEKDSCQNIFIHHFSLFHFSQTGEDIPSLFWKFDSIFSSRFHLDEVFLDWERERERDFSFHVIDFLSFF